MLDTLTESSNYIIQHKESSIDESLGRCHSSVIRYLQNRKQYCWDIKLWMLRNAVSKYCLTFYCYKDAKLKTDSDRRMFGLGYNVMINLLKESNCLNKRYYIFFDNFFSVDFARYLYSTESYWTETIRRKKQRIPDYSRKANINEVKYFRNNEDLFYAYRERKSVKNPALLISTKIAN